MAGITIIENKKIYGIAPDDIKKQSTSWLKGVKKVLAGIRESGGEVPDLEAISNEVNQELEKRLSAGATPDTKVTLTEPEKMRDVRQSGLTSHSPSFGKGFDIIAPHSTGWRSGEAGFPAPDPSAASRIPGFSIRCFSKPSAPPPTESMPTWWRSKSISRPVTDCS